MNEKAAKKYRKKPIVIEAYQTDKVMYIETLEGTCKADIGDYIITGVKGEQYPCKPDIFERTYEPVEELNWSKSTSLNGWISVKDRLPEEDKRVIVCCQNKKGLQNINMAYQVKGFWHGNGSMAGVTHWQPLPELPEVESE